MLSPIVYSLFTHDCVATYDSNTIIKFSDNTMVVGLITDDDERAYGGRSETWHPGPLYQVVSEEGP